MDPHKPSDHPLLSGAYPVGIISAENPRFKPMAQGGHVGLGQELAGMGIKADVTQGHYGAPEKTYIVHGPTREQMYDLGKKYGQEAVVYSHGGRHEMVYTNGPKDLNFSPGSGHQTFAEAPEDYYTHLPGHGYVRLGFDLDTHHPAPIRRPRNNSLPEMDKSERSLSAVLYGVASLLRKHDPMDRMHAYPGPHPHAYEWHDGHTDQHHRHLASGVHLRKDQPHPHMDAPPVNDQAAGAGAASYHQFAQPYGKITPGSKTNLFHYPYQGKGADIERLVKDHGYTPYYAGGKYGRPDLANKNYNTKHLMIYDPSPQSGGDFGNEEYTKGWRQIHELSHALTYPKINEIYGEGRRIGKLGTHRSMNEAQRAVHWEWLAGHKQRELSKQIGIHIPDEVHNREMNTLMHDAAHRAVTGKFTEPSAEGFQPHGHLVPLDTALGMVKEHGKKMGLQHGGDLLPKTQS